MLNFARSLLKKSSKSNDRGFEQDDQPRSPPSVVSAQGLPDFQVAQYMDHQEGFPFLNWAEAGSWLSRLESPASQAAAWSEMERTWLLHLREALGPKFRLRETDTAMLLSSLDESVARATLGYMERTLKRVAATLEGIAQIPAWGKDILIVFDSAESYYGYLSHHYPDEGEFALSSGMYVDVGCGHFVTVRGDLRTIEPVIAHEMTHGCLTHLPLPVWLNEGLAVNTEHRIAGISGSHPSAQELHQKHQGFWGAREIQEFWSGESFQRLDDGNMLSYDLARLLVEQFAKDWAAFKSFVLEADAIDAGAESAQQNLQMDLGAVVCALLEKGPASQWGPEPSTWPSRTSAIS